MNGKRLALVSFAILVGALAVLFLFRKGSSPSRLTRAEAISIAQSYVAHEWTPTEANLFHGVDAHGIRVDTPDAQFHGENKEHGWWLIGERNTGFPYKWGGFETPEEFDRG